MLLQIQLCSIDPWRRWRTVGWWTNSVARRSRKRPGSSSRSTLDDQVGQSWVGKLSRRCLETRWKRIWSKKRCKRDQWTFAVVLVKQSGWIKRLCYGQIISRLTYLVASKQVKHYIISHPAIPYKVFCNYHWYTFVRNRLLIGNSWRTGRCSSQVTEYGGNSIPRTETTVYLDRLSINYPPPFLMHLKTEYFFLHYTKDSTLTLLRNSLFNINKQHIFFIVIKST